MALLNAYLPNLSHWPSVQDVDEVLKRLPQDEVDARNQRLKRAMDLSLKHVYLPKDLQAVQTPYREYIMVSILPLLACKTCGVCLFLLVSHLPACVFAANTEGSGAGKYREVAAWDGQDL